MLRKSARLIATLALVFAMFLAACGGAAKPQAQVPTELHIAGLFASLDEPWSQSFLQAFERIKAQKPHGLTLTLDTSDNLWGDDAERALRTYADTGKYGIIWATSSYSDQVKDLYKSYPDILWAYTGSGNNAIGDNAYWTYNHLHEPAYLLGIVAGSMTKSNVIGAVAAYPYDDVNDVLNAYIDGARSVNPAVKYKVTFIESWYDPAKAKEAAYGIIAAGADYLFAEREGIFDACAEKGVYGFGNYTDQNSLAPKVVVSSTIMNWDPQINYLIDQWWDHVTKGTPYNAPKNPVWFGMAQGGDDIAPFHDFANTLPKSVVDKVAQTKQDILSGNLKVALKVGPPPTD